MASPSVTYNFVNGTVADGDAVDTNFQDLINAMTDGTKSFSIDALTVAGAALFNGAVTLGNATGDDVVVTGYLASNLISKTTNTYALGSSTILYSAVYATRILAGDGSAAAPAYSFNSTDNGDNGMYLSAANEVSFATAGTQRAVITSDGKVGIGHAPTGKFDVKNSGVSNYAIRASRSSTGNALGGIYEDASGNAAIYLTQASGETATVLLNTSGDSYLIGGNVGIGTTAPTYRFSVVGSATDATPAIEVNNSSDATKITLNCNGTMTADTSDWASAAGTTVVIDANTFKLLSSSLRYKTEIQELSSEIDSSKIYDLHAVTFRYKTDDKRTLGYIAEEVDAIIPAVVHREARGPNGEMVPESVAYSLLPVLIIEEMKKQQALISSLTERLEKLESKIAG